MADWGRRMQDQVDQAAKLWEALSNAGSAITMQIEVVTSDSSGASKRYYGPITKIANGKVSIRAGGGETITTPLTALAIRQLKRLLREASDKLISEPDAAFHYLMATAEFPEAVDLAATVGGDWPKELSATALAYFSGRMKVLAEMKENDRRREQQSLTQKYGRMPEWEQARKAANP
jgi:hypothetical protein